ncbi:hypothetical protein OIU77_000135 [Salix suchowensis]|uniref:DUF3475 domain-containing protein n=1 Tax=Salix suchowensis TaxID=1278906 RepID=A0ABQ9B7E3_9ROSI|nr:hypothetical protein OIU77_000135 [Salix suchowensis]
MALETWLIKVKTAISHSFDSVITSNPIPKPSKRSPVGVLAFEIAGLMSKLFHLWQSLSDKNIIRVRNDSISLEGVRKIVSNDESLLLGLACAEMAENLRLVAKTVSRLSKRCEDSSLRRFESLFDEFANLGRDANCWVLSWKDMEAKTKKMDRYVSVTATLYKEMEELSALENGIRKAFTVRSIFTVLARIKLLFGIAHGHPISLPRSLSASATVHPSENPTTTCNFVSGPLKSSNLEGNKDVGSGFFESNSKLLKPPATTLAAAALALHYANLIIVMEKMIKSPQLVGADARDDLYAMLPNSIRFSLRARLKGVGFSASDPVLAGEWRDALGRILAWLSPFVFNLKFIMVLILIKIELMSSRSLRVRTFSF